MFPREYYRYLHYRRSIANATTDSAIALITTIVILFILGLFSFWGGLWGYEL